MKAAVLVAQNKPLEVVELDIPTLDVGQILVKVAFSGICGKQMEEINGRRGTDPYIPHLLGHEGAGVVTDVGPGVRKVKAGDHIVLHWIKGSGIDSLPPRFQWNGETVSAGWVTTFSEYTVVSENRVTQIPEDIPLDVAALMGCAVTTGLGIVFNNATLMPGESIAVFGTGGIGQNVLQGSDLVSGHPIVAVDILEHKLDWASKMGATHLVNGNQRDLLSRLLELSGGNGFDVTVDTTGNRQVRETAYNSTGERGRTIFAGVPPLEDTLSIDSFPLHHGRKIIGSHGGDTSPDADIPRYLKLYQLGKLNLEEQITHRFPLFDINQAVDKVRQGEVGRCLITL